MRTVLLILFAATTTQAGGLKLTKYLPQVDDSQVAELLKSDDLWLYDSRNMPGAYQFNSGGRQRTSFFAASVNISGGQEQLLGNGNAGSGNWGTVFPWRLGRPGGDILRRPGIHSLKFLKLPRKDGAFVPVVYRRESSDDVSVLRWYFPAGTVLGEVVLRTAGGKWYPLELRIRTRSEQWQGRRFALAADVDDLARIVGRPIESRQRLLTASDRFRQRRAFYVKAEVPVVDYLSDKDVARILDGAKLQEVTGSDLFVGGHSPRGYLAPIASGRCAKCHAPAGQDGRRFDAARGLLGRIPGSDEVLSWYPVEPSSVSRTGLTLAVRIRKEFLESGMVRKFDAARDKPDVYPGIRK